MSTRIPVRRRRAGRWKVAASRLGILGVVLVAWQMAGDEQGRIGLPTFTRTMGALGELLADGFLVQGMLITNQALLGGYALALCVSLPLGILMGRVPLAERIAQPYLTVLLAVPMIAVIPIVQVVFGLTLVGRIVVVFLFSFIYIVVNVTVGVRQVDKSLQEMAVSFGATRSQMLRWVVLPGAVPAIMAGVRLGLGRAIIGMVVAELVLVGAGVGSLILEFEVRLQSAFVLAVVTVVVLEGVVLMEFARRLETRLARWRGGEAIE